MVVTAAISSYICDALCMVISGLLKVTIFRELISWLNTDECVCCFLQRTSQVSKVCFEVIFWLDTLDGSCSSRWHRSWILKCNSKVWHLVRLMLKFVVIGEVGVVLFAYKKGNPRICVRTALISKETVKCVPQAHTLFPLATIVPF